MISPNNNVRKNMFSGSKSPLRQSKVDIPVMEKQPEVLTPINKKKNDLPFKSPNSCIRDLINNKTNEVSYFENLLKKSACKNLSGNTSTNDRSRSSFTNFKNDDYLDKSGKTDTPKKEDENLDKISKDISHEFEKEKQDFTEEDKENREEKTEQDKNKEKGSLVNNMIKKL